MRSSKQKTLRAVARELNISAMTLYRVLNNTPGVSHAMRTRVTDALDKAGYLQARGNLRQTVLFDVQNDPYKQSLALALMNKISNLNSNILTSDHKKDKSVFLRMARDADTVIFFSSPGKEIVEAAKDANPDIFRINVSGGSYGDVIIGNHNYLGGVMAARYLYECGHRNVALVTIPVEPSQMERHKSFIGEMSLLMPEKPVHAVLKDIDKNWDGLNQKVLHLIRDEHITAIFVTCDYSGYQLEFFLKERGIRIPEDVSLLSYDHADGIAVERPVKLDTFDFDRENLIRMAEYYLLNRPISRSPVSSHCLIAPELKVYGSVKHIIPQQRSNLK